MIWPYVQKIDNSNKREASGKTISSQAGAPAALPATAAAQRARHKLHYASQLLKESRLLVIATFTRCLFLYLRQFWPINSAPAHHIGEALMHSTCA